MMHCEHGFTVINACWQCYRRQLDLAAKYAVENGRLRAQLAYKSQQVDRLRAKLTQGERESVEEQLTGWLGLGPR